MAPTDMVAAALLAIGCFLCLTGSIGLLRMPDFFSRLHAAGITDTLGQTCVLVGLMFHSSDPLTTVKLVVILFLLHVTAPTGTYAITRAAVLDGLKPWVKPEAGEAEAPCEMPTKPVQGRCGDE